MLQQESKVDVFFKILIVFATYHLVGLPSAQSQRLCGSSYVNKDTWNTDKELLRKRVQLNPWFNEIAKRIKSQTEYKDFLVALGDKDISCDFVATHSGKFEESKIVKSSGSHSTDLLALGLIERTEIIDVAPNGLPYQKGAKLHVHIAKSNSGQRLEVGLIEP